MYELIELLNIPICLAVSHTSELAPEYQTIAEPIGRPWWLIPSLGVAAATVAGIGLLNHRRVAATVFADDLTLELYRAHEIGLSHRIALDHVARWAGLTSPAALFLSPALFDQAVARAGKRRRLRGQQQDTLYEARVRMFPDA